MSASYLGRWDLHLDVVLENGREMWQLVAQRTVDEDGQSTVSQAIIDAAATPGTGAEVLMKMLGQPLDGLSVRHRAVVQRQRRLPGESPEDVIRELIAVAAAAAAAEGGL